MGEKNCLCHFGNGESLPLSIDEMEELLSQHGPVRRAAPRALACDANGRTLTAYAGIVPGTWTFTLSRFGHSVSLVPALRELAWKTADGDDD